jgi:hypothetical protein
MPPACPGQRWCFGAGMTSTARTLRITGPRVAVLIVSWLAFVSLIAPSLGLYYERLALWYALPSLGLVYAHCLSHRSRSMAILAWSPQSSRSLSLGSPRCSPRGPPPDSAAWRARLRSRTRDPACCGQPVRPDRRPRRARTSPRLPHHVVMVSGPRTVDDNWIALWSLISVGCNAAAALAFYIAE